jgi:hypothetical protein
MRNLFQRRAQAPSAEREWHGFMAIPGDRITELARQRLAAERLAGLTLYVVDDGSDGEARAVFVNVDAVEAEIDQRKARLHEELAAAAIERHGLGDWDDPEYRARLEAAADEDMQSPGVQARLQEITEAAFNNTDHWAKGGFDNLPDNDTRYSLFRVNPATGRIGPGSVVSLPDPD